MLNEQQQRAQIHYRPAAGASIPLIPGLWDAMVLDEHGNVVEMLYDITAGQLKYVQSKHPDAEMILERIGS